MSRKRKKANEAVPEEILAEGSGPTQDAESLAEAANEALANAPGPRTAEDEVVFDDSSPKRRKTKRAEVTSDEPVIEETVELGDEPEAEPQLEAAPAEPKRRRGRRREVISDDLAVEAAVVSEDLAIEASVLDSEVGPEVEEAELAAEQAAQLDEQSLEDAVMRAEAEAELGTAEAEVEPGEEDIELSAAALPTTAGTMDDLQLKHLVEALIFAADKPVTMQRLRQLTRVSDVKRLEQALATLAEDFADRGIALQQVSGGYQFRTNTQYSTWVQQLIAGRPVRLSRAQLETLAIVAYRQPITRPEVDEIRGVDSSATLRLLMDRALIRILGKKEEVGRPILYGTTKEFLDFFSLGDLRELPTLREYSELSAESRKVMSDELGLAPDGTPTGEPEESDELGEEPSTVEPQEVSVDDLVREFAEHDETAHVGAADDDAMSASDTVSESTASLDEPSDDVALSVSDGMVSAGDTTTAPDTMNASADEPSDEIALSAPDEFVASPDEAVSAPDEMLASPDEAVSAPDEMVASADEVVASAADEPSDDIALSSSDALIASPDEAGTAPDEVVSAPDEVVSAPDEVVSAPDEMVASPDEVVASAADEPSDDIALSSTDALIASPDEAVSRSDEMVASPDEMVASPDEMVASPDEPSDDIALSSSDALIASPDEVVSAADEVVSAPDEVVSAADEVVASAADEPSDDIALSSSDALITSPDEAVSVREPDDGRDELESELQAGAENAASEDLEGELDTAAEQELQVAADEESPMASAEHAHGGVAEQELGVAEPELGVAEPELGVAEPELGVAEPELGGAAQELRVAEQGLEAASDDEIDGVEPDVGERGDSTLSNDDVSVPESLDSTDEPPTD